jgi:hypothetical protein
MFPPTWWMLQDLWRGPLPIGDESDEAAYERHARRGFDTLADLETYWHEHRERLLAEYGAGEVIGWWAYRRFG